MSADQAGTLRTWHLKTNKPQATTKLASGIAALDMHPHTALAAAACVDGVVYVVDAQRVCTIVRTFRGHRDRPTAVIVSGDARWVISASLDGTLRVWDVPSASCLQALDLGAVATSISLSPGGELLATTHRELRGVYLWSNRMLFSGGACMITPSDKVVRARLPTVATSTRGDSNAEAADAFAGLEGARAPGAHLLYFVCCAAGLLDLCSHRATLHLPRASCCSQAGAAEAATNVLAARRMHCALQMAPAHLTRTALLQ